MSTEGRLPVCCGMKIIEYHDFKTLLGPCFISFSIPLLVPGVVLTIVGSYGNENTFPTFGGWHIVGILFLICAVLLLVIGILLKCVYRPIISIDIERHLSPTSSMITGNKNLGYEEEIYCSTNTKPNKINHHDMDGSHTVVSTHEAKTTRTKKSGSDLVANGAIEGETGSLVAKQQGKEGQTSAQSEGYAKDIANSGGETRKRPKPPSYEDVASKHKNKRDIEQTKTKDEHTSSSVAKTMQGQVKVTASIVAEAETAYSFRSHESEVSSTEHQTDHPEKKRKKKKKKHRKHSNMSTSSVIDETDQGITSTPSQILPELRAPPVLIHDGSHHHHDPDLHVHFQTEPAESDSTNKHKRVSQNTSEDSLAGGQPPETATTDS